MSGAEAVQEAARRNTHPALAGCGRARLGSLRALEALLGDTGQTGASRDHHSRMSSPHFFTEFSGQPWAGVQPPWGEGGGRRQ